MFVRTEHQLHSAERVILVTDGITERKTERGGRFAVDGLRHAVRDLENPTAATAMASLSAVTDC